MRNHDCAAQPLRSRATISLCKQKKMDIFELLHLFTSCFKSSRSAHACGHTSFPTDSLLCYLHMIIIIKPVKEEKAHTHTK